MLIGFNKSLVIYRRKILSIHRSRFPMPTMSTVENFCPANCAIKNEREIFKTINLLNNKLNVKSTDINKVEEKLKQLITAGPAKLQILADFDFTLSNYILADGSKAMSTHAVLENAEAKKLTEKYIVIEYDPNLTVEEKIPHMVEWWTRSHEELVKDNYNEDKLRNIIQNSKGLVLRKGFREFFALLEKYDIPIVIFSGGIGDIIRIILEENLGKLPKNVHIISNWMSYDLQGNVVGFKNPIVHSFNKNSSVLKEEDREFFVNLRSRPNILLMGDSLGDASMDVGLEKELVAFKIGFLNFSVEKSMQDYLEKFDILCVQDQTLDSTIEVLNAVIGPQNRSSDMNNGS